MAVKFDWLIKDRVIYSRTIGVGRKDDLVFMRETAIAMIAAGTPPVHYIADATYQNGHDLGFRDMREVFLNRIEPSPKRGWTVGVLPSPMLRLLASLAGQFGRFPQREFTAIEDALAFLVQQDDTLPDHEALMIAYRLLDEHYY
ncbi:MAG: hypothetical protein AAF787_23065 [Chloroflexota bacterium]